jgi:GTPase SAR1 family protein
MPSKSNSTRSLSHRKEDKSKRSFEEVIDPWYVTAWTSRDYGIDGVVEITSAKRNSEDLRLDSKFFFVQLKSTSKLKHNSNTISFSVPVRKINQWTSSNVPVLFVLNDLQNSLFYYIWMNEDLINTLSKSTPNWPLQETITIKIPFGNGFNNRSLDSIKEYVTDFKGTKRHIQPGEFFDLKDNCLALLSEYETLSNRFSFSSICTVIAELRKDIELSIYRIAIAGLSRVGKSSLINALLKREISPTGFFQTTSVPLQFIPGKNEYLEVFFQNDSSKRLQLSFDSINEYASQKFNEDNHKGVKLLSVSICNRDLQRGISIFDIPGLDDPDDSIVEYTLATLNRANAIFYVIDASPSEHGGFIFKNDYKKHIYSLGQSLDKIFLVFNKSDVLSSENLMLLKERVVRDLKKLNLYDKVAEKIYYSTTIISKHKEGLDSIDKLESDLWDYVINENKYGIVRLALINKEIFKSILNFSDILNARRLNLEERNKLEQIISDIQRRVPELKKQVQEKIKSLDKSITASLNAQKGEILLQLEDWLKSFSLQDDLPGDKEIKSFLSINLNKAIESGNSEFAYAMYQLKYFIDSWIEDNLKAIREILSGNTKNRTLDMTEIESFQSPEIDLSSAWGMGILGYVAGFLFNPAIATIAGVIGFFGNLLMSSESRRAKRILKILEESRKRYNSRFENLIEMFREAALEQSQQVNDYIDRKLNNYFSDIKLQMDKLHEPISKDELAKYKNALEDLKNLNKKVSAFDTELYSFKI